MHMIMAIGVTVAGLRLPAVTVPLTVTGLVPLAVTVHLVVVVLVAVLVTIGIGVRGAHSVSMPHAAASGNILAGSRVLPVNP
ncbi:MAG TPA: hypothetical protein VFE59_11620 [Trebonia sp.]|nr:hypothetical protein [Trebonia sp.]